MTHYTHWVDASHDSATNDQPGNGTPEKLLLDPWKGVKTVTLESGSVVVIDGGGPYYQSDWREVISKGTVSKPVFFRGTDPDNKVKIYANSIESFYIYGSYMIVENIELHGFTVGVKDTANHITLRNMDIHCTNITFSGGGAGIGGVGHDIIIYQSKVHDFWRINLGEPDDFHGINPGFYFKRWWVLENEMYGNSGDGLQATHNASAAPPEFLYIGDNIVHDNRENAFDFKYAADVIVSENKCYNYENSNGSDGSAIIIGSDGGTSRAWIMFNEIYDSVHGIRTEESADSAWIIGNVIHEY